MTHSSPLRLAAVALLVSAVLHLVTPVIAGFSSVTIPLFVAGLLYGGATMGLLRGMRWLAYILLIVMIAGMTIVIFRSFDPFPLPAWIYLGIFAADLVCFLGLFAYLWRDALVED